LLGRAKQDDSVATLVGQLVEDGRGLAKAEIALAKAKVGARVGMYKTAVILFAVAGTFAFAALLALLVGLIMTLATLVGPGLATAAVVVGTLVIAAVLAMIGKGKLATPASEETA